MRIISTRNELTGGVSSNLSKMYHRCPQVLETEKIACSQRISDAGFIIKINDLPHIWIYDNELPNLLFFLGKRLGLKYDIRDIKDHVDELVEKLEDSDDLDLNENLEDLNRIFVAAVSSYVDFERLQDFALGGVDALSEVVDKLSQKVKIVSDTKAPFLLSPLFLDNFFKKHEYYLAIQGKLYFPNNLIGFVDFFLNRGGNSKQAWKNLDYDSLCQKLMEMSELYSFCIQVYQDVSRRI